MQTCVFGRFCEALFRTIANALFSFAEDFAAIIILASDVFKAQLEKLAYGVIAVSNTALL